MLPPFAVEQGCQVFFDGVRVGAFRKAEAPGEPFDMGVYRDAVGFMEAVVCYDVGGFSADAGKGCQLFDGLRNFAAEIFAEFF